MHLAENDDYFADELRAHFPEQYAALLKARSDAGRVLPRRLDDEINADRHHRAATLFEAVTRPGGEEGMPRWQRADELFLHPRWGFVGSLAIFALVLFFVFEVSAFLDGLRIRCDRCLESFHRKVESQFHVTLVVPREGSDQEEIELLEEDMEVDFVKGDAVDLGDVVREQIYLSLPMQSICKESCRGLCPVCGANLNETSCLCRKTESPPAFSKLRLKGE